MARAVNPLRFIFDVETHPAEFEDSRTVLRNSQGKNFRQGNPATRSSDQQRKDFPALRLRKGGSAAQREPKAELRLVLAGIVELCFTAGAFHNFTRRFRADEDATLRRPKLFFLSPRQLVLLLA